MDIRSLSYFIAIYECKSISAAAKHCFISQPSISAALAHLEQHLNANLFSRHPKGVTPTDNADKLYPMAKQIIGQLKAVETTFKQSKTKVPFRLGLVEALGASRMTNMLKELTEAMPELELTLVGPQEDCDARVISRNMKRDNENFYTMWVDEFQMGLPLEHPLGIKPSLTLADLQELPFIYRSPSLVTKKLLDAMKANQISFNVCAHIRTIEYAIGLVAAGVGCALIPSDPSFNHHQQLILKPIDGVELTRTVGLAIQKKQTETQAMQHMIELFAARYI
jgi:LysR family transcriptional regulator, benzoate and cis,cis-muconate-responsive activator of ben and cat genes